MAFKGLLWVKQMCKHIYTPTKTEASQTIFYIIIIKQHNPVTWSELISFYWIKDQLSGPLTF